MTHPTVKECIKGTVLFDFYRKGMLHYTCANGFKFRIPIENCDDGTFNREDKGILFMYYIKLELRGLYG